MSTTYSFVCDDCQVKCWAGQSNYIYGYDYIAKFLHDHIGHRIRFLNDHVDDDTEDYNDVEETNTMKFKGLFAAVKDAVEYIENVADDRMESPLSFDRKKEVVKILSDFLDQDT